MNAHILVVEDEPAILELIAINLKHAGFEVTIAASAEAADEFVKAELPDAILLDWMLPGQSGMAFAKRLRAAERTRNLPIILLTARVHEEDKVQGLDSGADDYITKPFSPRELVSRLKAVLRRRAPHTSDERIESGGLSLNPATRTVMSDEVEISMSPTEVRLLAFLMRSGVTMFFWMNAPSMSISADYVLRLNPSGTRSALQPHAEPATASGKPRLTCHP